MNKDKLIQLYNLLTEWINEPDWNIKSNAWANIVETKRQVEIDIKIIDPEWESE